MAEWDCEEVFLSRSALLFASELGHTRLLTDLLAVADKLGYGKAWRLVTLKDIDGVSPWSVASTYETREIMLWYRPPEANDEDGPVDKLLRGLTFI
jgi:hypothetical protein